MQGGFNKWQTKCIVGIVGSCFSGLKSQVILAVLIFTNLFFICCLSPQTLCTWKFHSAWEFFNIINATYLPAIKVFKVTALSCSQTQSPNTLWTGGISSQWRMQTNGHRQLRQSDLWWWCFDGAVWVNFKWTSCLVFCLSEWSAGRFQWEAEGKRSSVHSGHGEDKSVSSCYTVSQRLLFTCVI